MQINASSANSGHDWLNRPALPLGNAEVVEHFGPVLLQVTPDGYYTIYSDIVLCCATYDQAFAVREFWALCGFD